MRRIAALLVVFWAICCAGADQEWFYRQFQSVADTNNIVGVTSPLLVDTNNRVLKVTNPAVSLSAMKMKGELGGVRLGMTMEEVVTCWGRPPILWSRCMGGPRFAYADVDVFFEASSNSVRRILLNRDGLRSVQFEQGLSAHSTTNDWLRVMGEPTKRSQWADAILYFIYETSKTTLTLESWIETGAIHGIRVERPSPAMGGKTVL